MTDAPDWHLDEIDFNPIIVLAPFKDRIPEQIEYNGAPYTFVELTEDGRIRAFASDGVVSTLTASQVKVAGRPILELAREFAETRSSLIQTTTQSGEE